MGVVFVAWMVEDLFSEINCPHALCDIHEKRPTRVLLVNSLERVSLSLSINS
jgi:hypothetical protein